MVSTQNRREFTRVQVNLQIELRFGGAAQIAGKLGNISLNGLFLLCDSKLPVGTPCEVCLILDGGLGHFMVQAKGRVTRIEISGIGIEFTELLGEKSLSHLRNLILHNSGEKANQVEQEFLEHTGLKNRH